MKIAIAALVFCLAATAAAPAKGQSGSARAANAQPSGSATKLPTQSEVDGFLQRVYGFDAGIKWKIVQIKPSQAPGVAEVIYYIGAEPRATHMFVFPDGRHAVAGTFMPFGPDPFAETRGKLAASTTGIATGPSSKGVLVEFSDLECPHCKAAAPVLEKLQQEVGLKLVFQQYPLPAIHPWSMEAAEYSDCIGRASPENAMKFNDAVFAAQDQIDPQNATDKLDALAAANGADASKLKSCVADPATSARVQQSIALGDSVDVTGTPSIYINGRKINTVVDVPYEEVRDLVKWEMEHAR